MRAISVLGIAALATACSIERAHVATEAQSQMVGLAKEQVLACMGPPAAQAAEGNTEVWSYNSGNDRTQTSVFGQSLTNASVYGNRNDASGSSSTFNSGLAVSSHRYCVVNVVMSAGRVSQVNYSGPTGGLLTPGEQCAFAVQNCVPK